MSRIADVLKKAAAEQPGEHGGEAPLPAAHTEPPPWEFEGEHRADRPERTLPRAVARHAGGASHPRARERNEPRSLVRGGGPVRLTGPAVGGVIDLGAVSRGGGVPPHDPPHPPVLARYWDIARRRWLFGLLVLVVVVAGVAAGLLLQEPVYRAAGLLEIRPESTAAMPVETLFSSEKMASDELETQYGILKSDALAERVLKQLGGPGDAGAANVAVATAGPGPLLRTAPAPRSNPAGPGSPSGATARPTAGDLERFQRALVINPRRGSRLVEVAFTAPDPVAAAATVNSVLDNYLQIRMEDAQGSARWLEQQLREAQGRLEASERQLQAFIRERGLEVFETGKGETAQQANERLQALHDALGKAQAERMEKQSEDEAAQRLSASRGVDSPVVQNLTVRLADLRREHAKLSSVFHEGYPAVKTLNDQIAELERALAEESRFVITRGQRDYQAALRKEALLRKALDEQNRVVQALAEQSEGHAGYESLKRELVTNQEQFAALSQKLKDVSVSAALKAANVGIVDRARPPAEPDGTPLSLALGLTFAVGLLFAAGGVVLREHFDTSMRSTAEVETYLGVPALGTIPSVGTDLVPGSGRVRGGGRGGWRPVQDGAGQSPLAEAFATLRNAVLLQEHGTPSRVLLVTSAQSEEGKTTISINLALSLARLHYRVLLIDGNLRYPCVQRALAMPDGPGLVEYLSGGTDWRASIRRGFHPELDVLVGGEPEASPADLLSLPRMGRLLDAAAREYDFVVVDSPALLTHPADVHSLAAVADSVLFAVRQGWTPREVVALALSRLDRVGGVVLNRSDGHEDGQGPHVKPFSIDS